MIRDLLAVVSLASREGLRCHCCLRKLKCRIRYIKMSLLHPVYS
jgi:hypothetical protein